MLCERAGEGYGEEVRTWGKAAWVHSAYSKEGNLRKHRVKSLWEPESLKMFDCRSGCPQVDFSGVCETWGVTVFTYKRRQSV